MEMRDIISVYENIYNHELQNRKELDDKMSSRLTFISLTFTLIGIQSKFIFNIEFIKNNYLLFFFLIISILLFGIQVVSFYRCFFRYKKDYMEMPITEIRKRHIEIGTRKAKQPGIEDFSNMNQADKKLLSYMKDSYIYCALMNSKKNIKRTNMLILFDNVTLISLLPLLLNYYILYMKGVIFQWLF